MNEPVQARDTDFIEHPVQLKSAEVNEIQFKSNLVSLKGIKVSEFTLSFARSDYVEEDRCIDILLGFEAGDVDLGKEKYFIKVLLRGRLITSAEMPREKVEAWAEKAAPFVLMPYLREQVYSLSVRCGMSPVTVPLYQVPMQGPALDAPKKIGAAEGGE